MARGTLKSDLKGIDVRAQRNLSEAKTFVDERKMTGLDAQEIISGAQDSKYAIKAIIDEYKATKSEENLEKFQRLAAAIEDYQGDKHFRRDQHKERRQEIAEAFNALPDIIKKQISVVGDTADFIQVLHRGGSHAVSAGPDGTINASFSSDKKWASFFSDKSNAPTRIEGVPRVYSGNDIESFDSIIDMRAFAKFRNSLADQLRFDPDAITSRQRGNGNKHPFNAYGEELNGLRPAQEQDEYLVTNLKWKKGIE